MNNENIVNGILGILFYAFFVLALFLAVVAMIRGSKVKKFYKRLDEKTDKKLKYSLRAVSFMHYLAGLSIVITFAIFIIIIIIIINVNI